MFARILIANRGEIACRIARSCERLGIQTVAVHTIADARALHVRAAGRAIALTGAGPADGYLDAAQLVDAARRAGADAIHPGYGFLAENATFAERCEAAGICFIGPDAATIRSMGDKAHARRIARDAGVPVVPGIEEESGVETPDRDHALAAAAAALAYPLMVKACAGGGGRGMRRVDRPADLGSAIAIARREAMAAFGDDRLIVERCIERPRHVEVQVLADAHGNVLHLHERDCSIQRRHQKLVEEAPAPGLADATRDALHAAALTLARTIGYRNAGTVEFVLDPRDQSFFFLEMNTRLQVEHPVTEAVLGLDLVEWQIRIAAGEPLALGQADLRPRGWAMEARINAEDPAADFAPATGAIAGFRTPDDAQVRLDSGVAEGCRVEPYYDSMLAKLIVHGHDRSDAATRLAHALGDTAVMGVRTNTAFLAQLTALPAFREGDVSTAFIPEHFPGGWTMARARDDLAIAAAAWFVCAGRARTPGPWHDLAGFRVLAPAGHPGRWRLLLDDGGGPLAAWVQVADGTPLMGIAAPDAPPPGAATMVAVRTHIDGDALTVEIADRRLRVHALESDGVLHLHGENGWQAWRGLDPAEVVRTGDDDGGLHGPLTAPVPGVVASIEVEAGDTVAAGAPLVVLESMKMYQTLSAPVTARVGAVHCTAGDAVSAGQVLVTLDPSPDAQEAAAG